MGRYPDTCAEFLLHTLYPEAGDDWVAVCDGAFYSSYSDDALDVDARRKVVHLSRQGFLKLLPSGYISPEDELRGGDFRRKFEALSLRKALLRDAFIPFDTVEFRRRLRLHRLVMDMQERRNELILKTFYGFDIHAQTDPYLLAVSRFIPSFRERRGQIPFVRSLLSAVVGCSVRVEQGIYSEKDTTLAFIPAVRFLLIIDGLDREGYLSRSAAIAPLCDFVRENLMPFDMECTICIKSSSGHCGGILDYNIDMR